MLSVSEMKMTESSLIYEYEIPDPNRPIAESERGHGPSGELLPFKPEPLSNDDVVGRQVDELKTRVGTYGMGGPGFFGLRLGNEWLVVAIWGAGEWIRANGVLVEDFFNEHYDRPKPWIDKDGDRLSSSVVGTEISSFEIKRHSMSISLSNGMSLMIDETAEHRPIHEGSKEPRAFMDFDDLRKVVFLSPTTEIWI